MQAVAPCRQSSPRPPAQAAPLCPTPPSHQEAPAQAAPPCNPSTPSPHTQAVASCRQSTPRLLMQVRSGYLGLFGKEVAVTVPLSPLPRIIMHVASPAGLLHSSCLATAVPLLHVPQAVTPCRQSTPRLLMQVRSRGAVSSGIHYSILSVCCYSSL
jgi:hypothetical protein